MRIVSSSYHLGHAQADGRRYVTETHVDHLKREHIIEYGPVEKIDYAAALAEKYATTTYEIGPGQPRKKKGARAAILGTVGLAVVLAVSLGGWAWYSKARKAQVEAIDKLLKETQELISRDGYGAYKALTRRTRPGCWPGRAAKPMPDTAWC